MSVGAGDWSGGVLIGTSLVLISIFRWGQSLWMIGRYIGLLAIHCLILQAFEQWILTDGLVLPDMETEAGCKCCNMHTFICRLEAMADEKTVRKILYRVRHGIHPCQSAWAREEFLEIGDLDMFLQKH